MSQGPWWVDPLVTGASILVGAGMIMWQQRASNEATLKLKLFEELRTALASASSAVTSAGVYAMTAPIQLNAYHDTVAQGYQGTPPSVRFEEFASRHRGALEQATDLIILLEAHDIVSEHFSVFCRALGCAVEDASAAFQRLVPLVWRTYPLDKPGTTTLTPIVPPRLEANFRDLKAASDAYFEAMNELGCYMQDIAAEAQNVLLGGLFKRRVSPRQPADPRFRVLRTDDPKILKELWQHFTVDHPRAVKAQALKNAAAARAEE